MKTSFISALLLIVATVAGRDLDKPIDMTEAEFYELVVENDERHVVKGDKPWFIEFYSPQCPHCIEFNPTWDEYHVKHKDEVNVARVNCMNLDGNNLCKTF